MVFNPSGAAELMKLIQTAPAAPASSEPAKPEACSEPAKLEATSEPTKPEATPKQVVEIEAVDVREDSANSEPVKTESPRSTRYERAASVALLLPEESTGRFWSRVVVLFFMSLPLVLIFGLLFTDMGYGGTVFRALIDIHQFRIFVASAFGVLFLVVYMTDMAHWVGASHKVYIFFRFCLFALFGAICIVSSAQIPALPVACFLALVPAYFYVVFRVFFVDPTDGDESHSAKKGWNVVPLYQWLSSLSIATGTVGFLSAVVWVVWMHSADRIWDDNTRELFKKEMNCPPEPKYCLAAFLLWVGHFIASCVTFVFSWLVYFLADSFNPRTKRKNHPALKLFGVCLIILLLGAWVASMLAGSETKISSLVYIYVFFCGVGMFVMVGHFYGWNDIYQTVMTNPNMVKGREIMNATWVKGLCGLVFGIPFLIYIGLSVFNKLVRRYICACVSRSQAIEDDKEGLLTARCRDQLAGIRNWDTSAVLSSMMTWGMVIGLFQLGGKLVYLFLAWLGDQLASVHFGYTTIIIYFTGFLMLLVPIVPGIPVYLLAGNVLVKNAAPAFGDEKGDGFWLACVYTCGICMLIKFSAIVTQQKGIGERMGDRAYIRSQVGIRSPMMQAISRVLQRPGMNKGKVFILCGGPDWPTSVLTGILKLNVWQMLYGSLPIIFLIGPTVLAGAFMYRKADGGSWGSAYTLVMAITVLVQAGPLAAATYISDKERQNNEAEIQQWLIDNPDPEVDKIEIDVKHQAELRSKATQWHKIPAYIKLDLILGAIGQVACTYVFYAAGSQTFADIAVDTKISEPPLNGKVLDFLKPLGKVIAIVWLLCIVFRYFYNCWADSAVKNMLKDEVREDPEEKAHLQETA